MATYQVNRNLVEGILKADSTTKAKFGQRFAERLGLTPGKSGRDGGIDGEGFIGGKKIYFQSKLQKEKIGAMFIDSLYGIITRHQSDIVIVLVGTGYTSGVEKRLQEFHDIDKFKIHLLTLSDYFNETKKFQLAVTDLPPLRDFRQ
ncbi:MAG: restriction endonuclease [Thiomargarita sp.]|nr:restriction endonuclease [Thiomargarita sp.]